MAKAPLIKAKHRGAISVEIIERRIYFILGQKVMRIVISPKCTV